MKRNIILAAIVTLAVGTIAMSPKKADGILGDCRKLLVAGDKLIAGGYFEKADRRVVNNIAQYDGAKWTGLAKGVDGIVRDLCSVGKDVYACGDFSYADKKDDGGVESNQVARWDGTKWNPLEKLNVDQQIHALATDGKNLYAGGRFTKIGGKIDASNIAKWDGKKWSILTKDKFESSVGAGTIIAMACHDGKLFASGGFQTIGDEPCSRIAIFDGKSWSEAGNKGLNGNVECSRATEKRSTRAVNLAKQATAQNSTISPSGTAQNGSRSAMALRKMLLVSRSMAKPSMSPHPKSSTNGTASHGQNCQNCNTRFSSPLPSSTARSTRAAIFKAGNFKASASSSTASGNRHINNPISFFSRWLLFFVFS